MELIQLPPPGQDPSGDQYRSGSRRVLGWGVAAGLVLVLVVVAMLNQHRAGQANRPLSDPAASAGPTQGPNQGPGSSPGQLLPAVACPQIRDEQAHLGYTCIDNYLQQDHSDTGLGLRIVLNHEVEPGWLISEGSGDPTSIVQSPGSVVVDYRAGYRTIGYRSIDYRTIDGTTGGGSQPTSVDVRNEVQRRTGLALQLAYGDNPSARTLSGEQRQLSGVQGYELVTEITIDPDYRLAQGLQVRTERLWVVGLPTPYGVSIFMMTIPDERRDLWPKAESIVGTVHLI
ncbi:MAG TPA: hypothetical protein VH298_05670 [Jatrophihabitans sp.]|nr:hypothetical protein [Jatrophihabitans sp.]